jgi:gliding motility-associated-like protein
MKQLFTLSLIIFFFNYMPVFGQDDAGQTKNAAGKENLVKMSVTDSVTPTAWVTKLLGNICYSNLTATGDQKSRGFFKNGSSSIAIDSGLVLSTGNINNLPGPNTLDNSSGFNNAGSALDTDLSSLDTGKLYNLSKVEFDITPSGNTLQFNYVFGSEDYCDHLLPKGNNDLFGIFISGPGITGSKNIAVVPNTSLPVTVSNINHQVQSLYYVNNNNLGACSALPAFNTSDCQLDGWTKVLTAQTAVNQCATYHVKIAIADHSNTSYASAVFIKSILASAAGTASAEAIYPAGQTVAYENCSAGKIRFKRTGSNVDAPLQVPYILSGTAVLAIDYNGPFYYPVTIPAGQTFLDVPVQVYGDGLTEAEETVVINLEGSCVCPAETFRIQDHPAISATLQSQTILFGTPTTLTPVVTGGVAPFSYLWNTGATTMSINTAQDGTYGVTVTDYCGFTASASANVTTSGSSNIYIQPCYSNNSPPVDNCTDLCSYCNFTSVLSNTYNYTPDNAPGFCGSIENNQWLSFVAGASAATITAISTNCAIGNGVQLALYNDCNSSPIFCYGGCAGCANDPAFITSALAPGATYFVMVDGYSGDLCDVSISITPAEAGHSPTIGSIGNIVGPDVVCPGGNVVFSTPAVTGAGGYFWSAPSGFLINGNDSPVTGSRQVTITAGQTSGQVCVQASNVCELTATVCKTITVTPLPQTTLPAQTICAGNIPFILPWGDDVYVSGIYSHIYTSYLGCDSTVNLSLLILDPIASITGGGILTCTNTSVPLSSTPSPGTKLWKNTQGQVLATGNNYTATSPGTYILQVTASGGGTLCTKFDTIVINSNTVPPTLSGTGGIIGCGSPSVQLSLTSDATAPVYNWIGPGGFTSMIANPTVTTPGNYTVTITSASNGCTNSTTVVVNGNTNVPTAGATGGILNCANPAISLNATSNVPNATFKWSGPGGYNATGPSPTTTVSGTYTVTVTNPGNNCTATATAVVTQDFAIPTVMIDQHPPVCLGQPTVITATSTFGTQFIWTDGNNQTVGSGSSISLTPAATGIFSYQVVVTAANGCTGATSTNITVADNPALSTIVSQTNCTQPTQNITLNVTGGTPVYHFQWSNAATTQNLTNLPAGTYKVTVSDANGCTQTTSATVTSMAVLSVSSAAAPVACFNGNNGAVTLTTTGGSPGYAYLWSNNATTSSLSNLVAGTYTVTVTDTHACTKTASATVTQPPALTLSATGSSAGCTGAGGTIQLTVSGGTPNYTFLWSNGATNQNLTGLTAGSFVVTATDKNGCTKTAGATITPTTPISSGTTVSPVSCFNGSNGAVTIAVAGGTPLYSYLWSNNATTGNLNNLTAGTYTLTITDANSCTATVTAVVAQPNAIVLTTQATPAGCNGTNGSVTLTVNGGTPLYTFLWSNGAIVQNLNGVASGAYTVTVTDSNGCIKSTGVQVTQLGTLTTSTVVSPVSCNGGSNGSVQLTINGGTPVFSYLWSNNATTKDLSNLVAGSYTVTITDGNGCTNTASATVPQPPVLMVSASNTPASCLGVADGSASLSVSGGTPGYQYHWSNNATTQNLTNLAAGAYAVTVTDNNQCTFTLTVELNENTVFIPTIVGEAAFCTGSNTTLDAGATYTCIWSSGQKTHEITVGSAGSYTVTVTNAVGCIGTASVAVAEKPVPVVLVGSNSPLCEGDVLNLFNEASNALSFAWQGPANFASSVQSPVRIGMTPAMSGPYTLTITGNNHCTGSATVSVQVYPRYDTTFSKKVCIGDSYEVCGKSFSSTGLYTVGCMTSHGCDSTVTLNLTVVSESIVKANPDNVLVLLEELEKIFPVTKNDSTPTNWTLHIIDHPTAGSADPLDRDNIRYRLYRQDFYGFDSLTYAICPDGNCRGMCDTTKVYITVQGSYNVITPNGDCHNDFFDPLEIYMHFDPPASKDSAELTIMNRWGEVVFQTKPLSPYEPWNGRNHQTGILMPQGTYYFRLRFKLKNEVILQGAVNLLR